jgi:hypothetical protein
VNIFQLFIVSRRSSFCYLLTAIVVTDVLAAAVTEKWQLWLVTDVVEASCIDLFFAAVVTDVFEAAHCTVVVGLWLMLLAAAMAAGLGSLMESWHTMWS